MPPKKQEKSSQSVKVSINLGDKKPRKTRGKKKPSQKKLPAPLGINPRQQPFSQQPQYIPLYVNQYPSYAGAGSPSYMNAGIPANPQILAGTSPLLLTNGSAGTSSPLLLTGGSATPTTPTTPTTSLTRMTSNANFNIPQSFYVPTEKPSYPRIDIKKRIEDIQRPKLITQFGEPGLLTDSWRQIPISTIGSSEFEQRRRDLMSGLGITSSERVNYVDPQTGLLVMSDEQGRREGIDYISLPLGGDPEDPYNEMVFQNFTIDDDDADEGFFETNTEPPTLEQINFL
jgi:hypothetical protein